jgi:hypothetical protein
MNTPKQLPRTLLALLALTFSLSVADAEEKVKPTGRTVVAEVVAFDQCFMLNRLGSALKTPRIFALRKDMETQDGKPLPGYNENPDLKGLAGSVQLKGYKRARPIVLRANVGDILEIRFTNLLSDQTIGQFAGCHVMGLSLAADKDIDKGIDSDSSWVGQNNLTGGTTPNPVGGSFAPNAGGATPTPAPGATPTPAPPPPAPPGSRVYRYLVDAEGVFILYSAADPNVQGDNQLNEAGNGLFGCVIVQPPNAEYYRSQVVRTDLIDATYHSRNLPANMVLRLRPKLPREKEDEQHWLLTTYRTRLHDFVTKNVEVVIGDAATIQQMTGPVRQEQLQTEDLERDMTTGASKKAPSVSKELKIKNAKARRVQQEKGTLIPEGYLYSPGTRHPLIDYGIAYTADHTRPAGWPVLEMLYPDATKVLAAGKQSAELGNLTDPKVYKLKEADKSKYNEAITQLDTGNVPRELWPVLNGWGIREMPKINPSVAPQRDYYDGGLKSEERIRREETANYIWLLTGVEIGGKPNSAVIIHGNEKELALRFVQVELQLFHSDLTAIITGPRAEGFGHNQETPSAFVIPASPDRAKPYREFALGYHNNGPVNQAFSEQNCGPLQNVLGGGADKFGINYGMAGIATEILANRFGVGPQGYNKDGVDLKFEEFFLSSWAVGDPAMLVDRPANGSAICVKGSTACPTATPASAPRATKAFYADDPSNVYHSYMRDHVKMRIYNAGQNAPHVHHLHAHQWLRSPNSDEASYLDSQLIVPGSAFSLEITYNGSGNRNQTVGDSIFHCHFYPHFAQGMWSMWRVHDVFEEGTPLEPDGRVVDWRKSPMKWVRALPDGEIDTGTPIPAIVPLPTLALPPIPPPVRVTQIPDLPANPAGGPASRDDLKKWVNISNVKDGKNPSMGRMAQVKPDSFDKDGIPQFTNPGYPFFVPGVAGHRPPHPPLDMGWEEKDGVPDINPDYTVSNVTNSTTFVMSIAATATGSNLSLTATNTNSSKTVPLSACSTTKASTTVTCASTAGLLPGMSIGGANIPPAGEKKYLDGGLPRHQVLGGQIVREFHTPWDFTKDYIRYEKELSAPAKEGDEHEKPVDGAMVAYRVPEDGTPVEKAAMAAHRTRTVPTVQADGRQGNFIHNGLPPISGAPFADPGVDDEGNAVRTLRKYKAAVIQKDVVFNKAGWHYPQQRFITLWQDVKPTFDEKRPAQPFFFRANSGETVEYWHTNLVPEYYTLDDFQVRTPTDIIGQHIHLVKFDVLASDGAVNGFNYEDGTISADDVRGRIHAITRPFATKPNAKYSLFELSQPQPKKPNETPEQQQARENYVAGIDWSTFVQVTPTPAPWKDSYLQKEMSQGKGEAGTLNPPPLQNWNGAMTTIQRFSTDPLLNDQGIDRTVRTVFTHDHFGPSTHQQAGLYAGFLVEPENSVWRDPVTGGLYYDPVLRTDGGPTGWEAIIEPPDESQSYREFAVEFQDLQLAYQKGGGPTPRPMRDVAAAEIQIVIPSTPLPSPGTPVGATITQLLGQYGISLTNKAMFAALPPGTSGIGIVDAGPDSLYNYGDNEAAFRVAQNTPTPANLSLTFLHGETWADAKRVIQPPKPPKNASTTINPQIISNGNGLSNAPMGTFSVNYRNEPLAPNNNQDRITGSGQSNDMSFAFASIDRPSPWNQVSPDVSATPCPPTPATPTPTPVPPLFARPMDPANVNGEWCNPVGFACGKEGVNDGMVSSWDPYTPLLRGYQGDHVQVRALVGAHTQPHSFTINGVKWLGEMRSENSGLRNAQEMGISEHFEFEFVLPPATTDAAKPFADYLYAPSSGAQGISNGVWGLMRSYDGDPKTATTSLCTPLTFPQTAPVASLRRLPRAANPRPYDPHSSSPTPAPVPDVVFTISAQATPIIYNDAPIPTPSGSNTPAPPYNLQNQQGIVYTVDSVQEKKTDGTLSSPIPGVSTNANDPKKIPPLILRVKAGQWVKVILKNNIPTSYKAASSTVGLHSQLVSYDVSNSDGMNVGFNPPQTVNGKPTGATPTPSQSPPQKEYLWYAGDLVMNAKGEPSPTPRELGATNLCPAAPLNQDGNGLVGALIVEPANSHWAASDYLSEKARILDSDKNLLFHDFVLIQQTNIPWSGNPVGNPLNSAVNNKSADLGFRLSQITTTPLPVWQSLSNSLPTVAGGSPNTPRFEAKAGEAVRFRVLQPGGDSLNGNIMFEIHGHSWQQEPWINSSSELGDNPKSNVLGADILVPHKALNILIPQAGGPDKVPGDYLYYNFLAGDGAWGIFRVTKD